VHHNPLHDRDVPHHLRLVTRHSLLTYSVRHWPGWQFRLLGGIIRLEAKLRRSWAWWRRDNQAAEIYLHLDAIAADLVRNNFRAARNRLERVIRTVSRDAESSERSAVKPAVSRSAPRTPRRG